MPVLSRLIDRHDLRGADRLLVLHLQRLLVLQLLLGGHVHVLGRVREALVVDGTGWPWLVDFHVRIVLGGSIRRGRATLRATLDLVHLVLLATATVRGHDVAQFGRRLARVHRI